MTWHTARAYLAFNQCCDRKIVKQVCKVFPDIGITIFPQTFIVKAVYLGDLAGFVVATQNSYPGWIADLEGNQKSHRFHRVIAPIHIVTHEKIICVWNFTSNSKQLHQVMELTVHVSTNGHWRLHWLDICFLYKNLLGLHTGIKIP